MFLTFGFAAIVPTAEAGCYVPTSLSNVGLCATANAGAFDEGGTSYRFTSDGSGSATIPATVTMTSSKTAGGSCAVISNSCSIPMQVNTIPKFATGPCNTVSVRTAVTGVGVPSVTDSDTACAGAGLIDPVGLLLEVEASVANTYGTILP